MHCTNRSIYMPLGLLEAFSKHTGLLWSGMEIEGAICGAIARAVSDGPPAEGACQ